MAALELGLFPLAQLKRHQDEEPQIHQKKRQRDAMPPGGNGYEDEDDSWEVRAFAEDTNSALGTTWPPRFYACNFCRREFRSAQALGGHMNVHRRDRARAQLQSHPPLPVGNGRYCFLYPLAAGPGWVRPSAKTLPSASLSFGATDFSMPRDVVKEDGKGVGPDLELRLGRC